jgi:4-hydroxy-tetrahydrodipicolinate reductase
MEQHIRILLAGAAGRMGREVIRAILHERDLQLVGAADIQEVGTDICTLVGLPECGVTVSDDLPGLLASGCADVLVDFTNPQAVVRNALTALASGVSAVIGSTGIDELGLAELQKVSEKSGRAVLIAPNFALGAVLMMDFAQQAARYFRNVEIIELHHDQKIDAPSGTSLKTAQMIERVRKPFRQGNPEEYEKIAGVRGGDYEGIRIHSVRLPGFVAHQEVIFGDRGQTLTIRHDSMNRESFMPGVMLAVRRICSLTGVIVGLENILD